MLLFLILLLLSVCHLVALECCRSPWSCSYVVDAVVFVVVDIVIVVVLPFGYSRVLYTYKFSSNLSHLVVVIVAVVVVIVLLLWANLIAIYFCCSHVNVARNFGHCCCCCDGVLFVSSHQDPIATTSRKIYSVHRLWIFCVLLLCFFKSDHLTLQSIHGQTCHWEYYT